ARGRGLVAADPAAARAGEAGFGEPRSIARAAAKRSWPADLARGAAGSRARAYHRASRGVARESPDRGPPDARRATLRRARLGAGGRDGARGISAGRQR